MTKFYPGTFPDSKAHYPLLDGLRGVAAIMVVWYHVFEGYATSRQDQIVNHGYLAVDFFFLLSGFVIAYAYDDRWKKMSIGDFLKRRIIRLHPMVVLGALIGGLMFYTQGCDWWDVSKVAVGSVVGSMVLNMFLLPSTPGMEVRGLGEMFPLNGPSWSLFFEYIGNVLYALIIRRFSTPALIAFVTVLGIMLMGWTIGGPQGDISYGWQLTEVQGPAGFLRMMFPFSLGLLMFRLVKPGQIKGAFWIASIVLIGLLAMPRIGDENSLWMNGIYEIICIVLVFPGLLYVGLSGTLTAKWSVGLCKFLGDISYPLYIVHYPFIYLYIAWVKNESLPFSQSWPGALAVLFGSMAIAYLSLKYYDVNVRRWLTTRFSGKRNVVQPVND